MMWKQNGHNDFLSAQCAPLGKAYEPAPGADKWRLRPDHSLEILYPEYAEIGAGGWRNKARCAFNPVLGLLARSRVLSRWLFIQEGAVVAHMRCGIFSLHLSDMHQAGPFQHQHRSPPLCVL